MQIEMTNKGFLFLSSLPAMADGWKEEIKDLLQNNATSLKLDKVCALLKAQKLMYSGTLKPGDMLAHPQNRGGALVGPYDVHVKGQKLVENGTRKQLLEAHSYCIEMSPMPDTKASQLEANQALAKAASGLLAAPTGDERFLTVGASHSTCFARCMQQCCIGPDGKKLSIDMDGPLQKLIEEGWQWQIITSEAEKIFPTLPTFVSVALNSSNSNQVGGTELECAAQMIGMYSESRTLDQCAEYVASGQPRCKEYLQDIAFFIGRFGGGSAFPLIKFAEAFGHLVVLLVTFCLFAPLL